MLSNKRCCTKLNNYFNKWAKKNSIDVELVEWYNDIESLHFYDWKFDINNKTYVMQCDRLDGSITIFN